MLSLYLFGDFRLLDDDTPITQISGGRQQALLAYLALHQNALLERQALAERFWPESSHSQALANLRGELHNLRQAVPQIADLLLIDRSTIRWQPGAHCTVDVLDFLAALHEAELVANPEQALAALRRAVELYQGDLLPHLLEAWIEEQRIILRDALFSALDRLSTLYADQHDYDLAIDYLLRLLQQDPVREEAYRRLMYLYAMNDDADGIRRAYRTCAEILERELDASPSIPTRDLYEQLSRRDRQATSRDNTKGQPLRPPLINRQTELRQLEAAWQRALRGHAHSVLITGEAGIGKSHLLEELLNTVHRRGHRALWAQAHATTLRGAYGPIADWLRTPVLQDQLPALHVLWRQELACLLPELAIADATLATPVPLPLAWQAHRLHEALDHLFGASGKPFVLALDNLHWCDVATLDWLYELLTQPRGPACLLVATLCPSEQHANPALMAWLSQLQQAQRLSEIQLGPLDLDATARLGAALAGHSLPPTVVAELQRQSDGNPFLIVEAMHTAQWENGECLLQPSHSPAVQALMTRQLEQISPATQQLAGLAATIGPTIPYKLLRALVADEGVLVDGIDELLDQGILYEAETAVYHFRHDPLREAAYTRLSPTRRRFNHSQIAQALAASAPPQPWAQIALHYAQAADYRQAVYAYQAAADQAKAQHAYPVAVAQLQSALPLLDLLPANPEHQQLALNLNLELGALLAMSAGAALPTVAQRFAAICGLWEHAHTRGRLAEAHSLAEELLHLAEQESIASLQMSAHTAEGLTHFYLGDFTRAQSHLQQAQLLYQQQGEMPITLHEHGYVAALCYAAFATHILGNGEQAERQMKEAVRVAQAAGHPYALAYAYSYHALFHFMRRDCPAAHQAALSAWEHAQQYHYLHASMVAQYVLNWATAAYAEQRALFTQFIHDPEASDAEPERVGLTDWLCTLAAGYLAQQQLEPARARLDEARALMARTGETFRASEIQRVYGELLWLEEKHDEAAAVLQEAITTARRQQARFAELSATMTLCRLWQRLGRRAEAQQRLVACYSQFKGDSSVPELRTAQELLAELQAQNS
ncbi:MAG: AAA family ATPase [Caldilineaceae bacterium]